MLEAVLVDKNNNPLENVEAGCILWFILDAEGAYVTYPMVIYLHPQKVRPYLSLPVR